MTLEKGYVSKKRSNKIEANNIALNKKVLGLEVSGQQKEPWYSEIAWNIIIPILTATIAMYLELEREQCENNSLTDYYNVGSDDCDCVTTGQLVDLFCEKWDADLESGMPSAKWENRAEANAPHEAGFLKLDSTEKKINVNFHDN